MSPRSSLLLAVCLAGCSPAVVGGDPGAGTSSAISGGSTANSRTSSVLIASGATTTWHYCGATLVAPDLLLTAAHCVHPAYVGSDATTVVEIDGQEWNDNGIILRATSTMIDPGFVPVIDANGNASHDPRLGSDVALVQIEKPLSSAISSAMPVPVYTAALDASLVGAMVNVIGYIDPDANVGPRRSATMTVDKLDTAGIYLDTTSGGGQVCGGDSGGSNFATIGGTEYLIGVTNGKIGGSGSCGTTGAYSARLDTNLDFLGQYLPSLAPPTADNTDPTGDPPENG